MRSLTSRAFFLKGSGGSLPLFFKAFSPGNFGQDAARTGKAVHAAGKQHAVGGGSDRTNPFLDVSQRIDDLGHQFACSHHFARCFMKDHHPRAGGFEVFHAA